MERLILIIIILLLIGAYWWHTLVYWNETHADGIVGKVITGIVLTAAGIILLFNLGLILNH